MSHRLSSLDAVVDAIRSGRVVIVMDAEDRENEGDFVCAAEKITPEIVNFMITHGKGQVCIPVLPEVCQRLDLHHYPHPRRLCVHSHEPERDSGE